MGDAARQDDGVNPSAEGGGHGADLLHDAVAHGVLHHAGFFVALTDALHDLYHGVGPQMRHETAFAGQHLLDVVPRVAARKAEIDQFAGGKGSGALRCERSVAVEGVVHIDDAALLVGCDRDAAAEVGDHEVRLLVDDADAVAVQAGRGFLVECVEDRTPRAVGMPAQARYVVHFVHDHGVGDVGFDACGRRDSVGQQAAEVGGVLHRGVLQVAAHGVVHFVHAGGNGFDEAAAADYGRERHDVEAVFLQCREDHVTAPVELVDDVGVVCDLFRRVTQGQIQQRPLLVVEGDLR